MSSVSEMRSAVAQQERINSQLRNELYALSNGISKASNSWYNLTNLINNTLNNGANRVISSHERTVQAYELQCEIEKMYKLFKNIELANKKIRACKNKIYYEFANYSAVRKIVQAMLNNIETTFVSDATITKAVEVKHLQLPDYWLTCALLSIMAWRNDDKQLAQKALERACKLDKKNTSIFFFAFHIRIGKDNVALKWFSNYITCARTGEDQQNIMLMFSIINKTIVENCNDELISKINGFINQLIKEDISRSGYSEDEVIERIRAYLGAYRANDSVDYPLLANYCKEMDFLKSELMAAKSNIKILDFILKTVNVTVKEKNDFLNQFIDDLIAKTNKSEKDISNEIKYNELVISHNGNVEAAKSEYDEWLTHNETEFTIITEMIDWIYKQDSDGMNPTIRQMMFKLTKNLNHEAIKRNVEAYRNRFKKKLDIKINEYETKADFSNVNGECTKIEDYFNNKAQELIALEKMWPCFIWFGIGAAAIAGTIAMQAPQLLVGTAIGAIGGIIKIVATKKKKERIAKDCEIASNSTKGSFMQLAEEFKKFVSEYHEYDNYYNEIESEFAKL